MAIYYFTISILTGMGFLMSKTEANTKPQDQMPTKRNNMLILYLTVTFIVLTFLTSFRYAIGFDYFSYRDIYQITAGWSMHDIFQYYWYEPLFFIVCKFFNLIGLPFELFLTGINLFFIFIVLRFIFHYSKIPWISVYLYITLQFLAYQMNLLRQSIAVCFFLLAYPYLQKKKLLPFAMLLFVGGLFHNSLWFVFPLYFLLTKKLSRIFVTRLLVLAFIGYLFFDPLFTVVQPILPEKYTIYQETYFWNSNTWDYILPSAFYAILIFLFRNEITDEMQKNLYLNSALYNFLISVFITKHFILERFAIYPFTLSLIAIPDIIASCQKATGYHAKAKSRSHCTLLLFLLYGGTYFLFAAIKGFHHVYPYISLLDKSHSTPIGM